MERLGHILVNQGACTPDEIQEALENQVIFGGRLGTNLIETGAIQEADLARALGEKFGVPWMAGDDIFCEPEALALVGGEYADRWDVVPHAVSGRRLTVLCADPSAFGMLDEVGFNTSKVVRPVVVTEARLWTLLRDFYGIDRKLRGLEVRFASLRDRRKVRPAGPPAWTEPLASASRGTKRSRVWDPMTGALVEAEAHDAPGDPLPGGLAGLLTPVPHLDEAPPSPTSPPQGSAPPPAKWPVEVALTAIGAARDRHAVTAVLVRHAAARFERVVLFRVEGEVARAVAPGGAPGPAVAGLALALDGAGIVATAVQHGSVVEGPLEADGSDRLLVEALGGAPARALAVPVLAAGRIAGVLYADGGPRGAHDPAAAEAVANVADAAGRRYGQLPGRR